MLKKSNRIFFLVLVPIIELRVAIPVSLQGFQLPLLQPYIAA